MLEDARSRHLSEGLLFTLVAYELMQGARERLTRSVNQKASAAVHHGLERSAGLGGDHRLLAVHGLDGHNAEMLIRRRVDQAMRSAEQVDLLAVANRTQKAHARLQLELLDECVQLVVMLHILCHAHIVAARQDQMTLGKLGRTRHLTPENGHRFDGQAQVLFALVAIYRQQDEALVFRLGQFACVLSIQLGVRRLLWQIAASALIQHRVEEASVERRIQHVHVLVRQLREGRVENAARELTVDDDDVRHAGALELEPVDEAPIHVLESFRLFVVDAQELIGKVAVEEDAKVAPLEHGHWQADLIADDDVEAQVAEQHQPQRGDEHLQVGEEGVKAARNVTRQPASAHDDV